MYVRCFGNFEVFYNGEIVHFGRNKSKELFAYLVDRKGASATNSEIRAALWGDRASDDDNQKRYFSQIVFSLRETLKNLGEEDVLIQHRDSYAVMADHIKCDYYLAEEYDLKALSVFEGEYMSQYEWAEERIGYIGQKYI